MSFLPWHKEYRQKPDPNAQYIFCSNHFSYLDIPAMGLTPIDFMFLGKSSLGKIPVFGYIYRKLHLTIDRRNLRNRYEGFIKARKALEEGLSLVVFPEGGVVTKVPPHMAKFKDGAFRLAIEQQVPIVPVTLPNNWKVIFRHHFYLTWGIIKIIYHEPVDTKGYTLAQVDEIKGKVFRIIEAELKKQNAYAGRQADFAEDSTFSQVGAR